MNGSRGHAALAATFSDHFGAFVGLDQTTVDGPEGAPGTVSLHGPEDLSGTTRVSRKRGSPGRP